MHTCLAIEFRTGLIIHCIMKLRKKANLIIYRFQEKGLEIFLVNPDEDNTKWGLPQGAMDDDKSRTFIEEDRLIELDPVAHDGGDVENAVAVEGDWHEIPSLKSMLTEDAQYLKDKLRNMEKGTYFALKEVVKKVLPHQYEFIKELKDILVDRNSVKDI